METNSAINLEARKLKIIQAVLSAKEGVLLDNLEKMASFIGTSKEEELIEIQDLGFWLDGKSVTEESFYARISQNQADKKANKHKSQEAFENEAQNW